jgi:hypothetical protein
MPKLFINPKTAARMAEEHCARRNGVTFLVEPRTQRNHDGSCDIGFVASFTNSQGFHVGTL